MSAQVSTWVAALLTLGILTFLHKDNPIFRLTESIFAGVSLGYFIGIVLNNTLKPNLVRPLADDFWNHKNLLFAGAIGVLLYFRYIPKVEWISRFALATYIGYYVGITMVQKLQGEVLPQMKSAIRPMNTMTWLSFNNLIYFIGVLSVLIYFFFSKKHEGAYGRVASLGIWFLMVSFGAAFGYTVMGRVSLLIGRFDFLINVWLRPIFFH